MARASLFTQGSAPRRAESPKLPYLECTLSSMPFDSLRSVRLFFSSCRRLSSLSVALLAWSLIVLGLTIHFLVVLVSSELSRCPQRSCLVRSRSPWPISPLCAFWHCGILADDSRDVGPVSHISVRDAASSFCPCQAIPKPFLENKSSIHAGGTRLHRCPWHTMARSVPA